MKLLKLLPLAALSLLSSTAQAQESKPAAAKNHDADQKVCRRQPAPTGSIMPGKRVCHSRAEWESIDSAHQAAVDHMRDLRSMGTP